MSDLIDRQAILKHIEKIRQGVQMMDDIHRASIIMNGMHLCEEAVRNQPSARPEQRWIPCSERLPETTDPVIITWVNHKPEWYYDHIKDKPFVATGHYCNGRWYWFSDVCQDYLNEYGDCEMDRIDSSIEVIAWMPMPEPYKEDNR